jgi:hypothetical protein
MILPTSGSCIRIAGVRTVAIEHENYSAFCREFNTAIYVMKRSGNMLLRFESGEHHEECTH